MIASAVAMTISAPVVVLGLTVGLTYGLLAVGLILVYRSSRIINFAHGEIGGFGAAVLAVAVIRWHLPYPIAFVVGLVGAAAAAAVVELVVVRRLRNAPTLMSVIATLGAGQFLLLFSLTFVGEEVRNSRFFPEPSFLPQFDVGALLLTPAHVGLIVLAPLSVLALVLVLGKARVGLQIRSAATNADAARLAGVKASRMPTYAWMMAGALAGLTAMLVFPTQGVSTPASFGPALLLRGLTAAVLARMDRLFVALLAGLGLGVIEQTLRYNASGGGRTEMVLFAIIIVALLLQRRDDGRSSRPDNWGVLEPWARIPAHLSSFWEIRHLSRVFGVVAIVFAVALGAVGSNRTGIVLVSVLSLAAIGLSLGVLTGVGGMLSLGQFAIAGVGAVAGYRTVEATDNALLGVLAAMAAGAVLCVVVGLPSLRLRGNMLAVSTLAFAVATETWLLQQPWMLGTGVTPQTLIFGPWTVDTGREYYMFALVVFCIALLVYRNVRSTGLGRILRAVRDNESAARAFTIAVPRRKMQSFALAGAMAGVGGMLYAFGLSFVGSQTFSSGTNITLVAMCLIGGLGLVVGPLLGALYLVALPAFIDLDAAGQASTALGWLILVLYFPGGLAELVAPVRVWLIRVLARRRGVSPDATVDSPEFVIPISTIRLPHGERHDEMAAAVPSVILTVSEIEKRFGGVAALDGVSFDVRDGETIGLLGPNGAGKTTLFEIISGFTSQDSGTVTFRGDALEGLPPEVRARRGVVRSFQDGALFSTLTVREILQLAQERRHPTRLGASVLGLPRAEANKRSRAEELAELMGLGPYRDLMARQLSTGTRRITELACIVALEPKLLLLDEPSSGIAQRESEALADVLRRVKHELGTTLVLVEHDVPLLTSMSDRIVAMAEGRIICVDTPSTVCNHPEVVRSYLGDSRTAIDRSTAARSRSETELHR